jgi:hypothetical protein
MGALRVFCLMLEPRSHELCGVLDAISDYLLGLCVRA